MIIGAIICFALFFGGLGYVLSLVVHDKRRGEVAADMAAKAYGNGNRHGYETGYKDGYLNAKIVDSPRRPPTIELPRTPGDDVEDDEELYN